MSKRSKFVFCTWVGPNVSVMKKAKMSTDKALMKELVQNLSVELQIENANEFTMVLGHPRASGLHVPARSARIIAASAIRIN